MLVVWHHDVTYIVSLVILEKQWSHHDVIIAHNQLWVPAVKKEKKEKKKKIIRLLKHDVPFSTQPQHRGIKAHFQKWKYARSGNTYKLRPGVNNDQYGICPSCAVWPYRRHSMFRMPFRGRSRYNDGRLRMSPWNVGYRYDFHCLYRLILQII